MTFILGFFYTKHKSDSGNRIAKLGKKADNALYFRHHTPGTALNDQYAGPDPWAAFLDAIEAASPPIRAAARPKCSSSAMTTKYRKCLNSVIIVLPPYSYCHARTRARDNARRGPRRPVSTGRAECSAQ
jgi:hypothetical protein